VLKFLTKSHEIIIHRVF